MNLTPKEIEVVLMVLRVDLDALGLERKYHGNIRSVIGKLKKEQDNAESAK